MFKSQGYRGVDFDENGNFISKYEQPRNKKIAIRVYEDIFNWLTDESAETGKTKSEIVIEALEMLRRSRSQEKI